MPPFDLVNIGHPETNCWIPGNTTCTIHKLIHVHAWAVWPATPTKYPASYQAMEVSQTSSTANRKRPQSLDNGTRQPTWIKPYVKPCGWLGFTSNKSVPPVCLAFSGYCALSCFVSGIFFIFFFLSFRPLQLIRQYISKGGSSSSAEQDKRLFQRSESLRSNCSQRSISRSQRSPIEAVVKSTQRP